jgi:hypothetical protein
MLNKLLGLDICVYLWLHFAFEMISIQTTAYPVRDLGAFLRGLRFCF